MKSELTKRAEESFLKYLHSNGTKAVEEVDFGKHGIVDILGFKSKLYPKDNYNELLFQTSKGYTVKEHLSERDFTWYCYEVKISKQDFYSPSMWTFIGDYNYFVMPLELYNEVKEDIPDGIGVYSFVEYDSKHGGVMRFDIQQRARKFTPRLHPSNFIYSMLTSLHREKIKTINNNSYHVNNRYHA